MPRWILLLLAFLLLQQQRHYAGAAETLDSSLSFDEPDDVWKTALIPSFSLRASLEVSSRAMPKTKTDLDAMLPVAVTPPMFDPFPTGWHFNQTIVFQHILPIYFSRPDWIEGVCHPFSKLFSLLDTSTMQNLIQGIVVWNTHRDFKKTSSENIALLAYFAEDIGVAMPVTPLADNLSNKKPKHGCV